MLLVFVVGIVEPLHQHADHGNVGSKAPCVLCISSHSSAPAALPSLSPPTLTREWQATEVPTESYSRPHLAHPFTRPPPAV